LNVLKTGRGFPVKLNSAESQRGFFGLGGRNQHTYRAQRTASKAIYAAQRLALQIHRDPGLLQIGARNLRA